MRKIFIIIPLCLSALLLTVNPLAAEYSQDYVPNELLIKFKTSFNQPSIDMIDAKGANQKPSQLYAQAYRQKIQQKLSKHHVTHQKVYSRLGFEHWTLALSTASNTKGQSGKSLEAIIEELKNDPDVLLVEPNYRRYPRSLHYISGANAKQLSDATLAQIKLQSLPGVSVGLRDSELLAPIETPVVAIIDDAFEISHEDFPPSKIIFPRNSIELDSNPTPHSCKDSISRKTVEESHGTQVMGVLAAGVDNGIGLNGATDDTTQIIPIRVGCNYTVKAEVDAIEWAVENGADIINMSYGSPLFSEFERMAILSLIKKNILVVAAAGNFEVNNDRVPDYPSGLGLPNIIAVAAVDSNNNLTKWSQYGQTSVDIAAPGDNFSISATAAFNDDARNTGYVKTSGTSFSAPLVSGVAASLLARFPDASVYDVKGAIIGSAVSLTAAGDNVLDGSLETIKRFKGRMTSGGAIDAMAAADLLSSPPKPVVVIKNIRIDDSLGNKNGQIDAGEVIDIVVTLENIWAASDSLTVTLSSPDLALSPIVINSFLGLEGFNSATTNRFGTVEKRFRVNFANQMTKQNLLFLLDVEGEYTAIDTATNIVENKEFIYERAFRVNTGSLTLDNVVEGTLRVDDQDDVHYYHVYVPETKSKLIINLSMLSKSSENNLNLMVNRSQSPEFYFSLYDSNIANYVSRGTEVSANGGSQDESITLTDVSGGSTVYIAIAGSENIDATNIKYSISISGKNRELAKGSVSGCSLGGPLVIRGTVSGITSVIEIKAIDPTLPLLLFVALFSLIIRRKQMLH